MDALWLASRPCCRLSTGVAAAAAAAVPGCLRALHLRPAQPTSIAHPCSSPPLTHWLAQQSHPSRLSAGGCPTLTNMLVIVVGGIPIAMPTVLSVTLALGAYALAKVGPQRPASRAAQAAKTGTHRHPQSTSACPQCWAEQG